MVNDFVYPGDWVTIRRENPLGQVYMAAGYGDKLED